MLYVVPTPIGNLEDITFRAVRILKEVNLILAEDTRTSKKLLDHYAITTPLQSYHTHNEHNVVATLVQRIIQGSTIALVSDAGTPAISDPGFLLVRACLEAGIKVECLPGATAFVPALINSGLPAHAFHFDGFLPHKKGRQTRLKFLSTLPHTFILYESPFRLVKCLEELMEHCGQERQACVCRELSKLHEENKKGTLSELTLYYTKGGGIPKGEIVIVVEGLEEIKKKSSKYDLEA
jgi:16S rRNA (cytidine1402-2'-O)-methyltransferase